MKKIILILIFTTSLISRSLANGGCAFTYQADSINNMLVSFTYTGWPGPATYTWDFGDSVGTSTLQNPTYLYSAPGNYTVSIHLLDTNGIICDYSLLVSVGGSINCSFIYSGGSTVPATINFIDNSIGNPISYHWDFGDGTFATTQNPSHTYTSPGTYSVCESTSDANGILCTSCQSITISGGCTASFQYSTSHLDAYFVENSVNTNLSTTNYQWTFGDGSLPSTARYPSHTYPVQGTYFACLTINDSLNCIDSTCRSISVDTFNLVGCMAEFLFTELQPYSIGIVNSSFGWSPSYQWDFGDGDTSNLAYPSHTYNAIGSYIICLTVSDTTGCLNTFCDSLNVDSLGNISVQGLSGFTISVLSPSGLTSSIKEINHSNFSVYPNPARDNFIINNQSAGENKFVLYSFTGAILKKGNLLPGINVIDVLNYSSGIYLLEITNDKNEHKGWKIVRE
jgi:PKD repeat protein